jgi:hypothetical protein
MKTRIITLIALLLSCLNGWGQATKTNKSVFNLRFQDEATGIKVIPEYVTIKQRRDANVAYDVSKDKIADNGTVSVEVLNGTYDFSVSAPGYEPMVTYFEMKDQVLNVSFNLVPLHKMNELSVKNIRSQHRQDAVIILGIVVDELSGEPMGNVSVSSIDEIAKTLTNDQGFFQLTLPLASNKRKIENRGTLVFKKDNYRTEVRQKFDMWSYGDLTFRIRMTKGHGVNKIDLQQKREPYRETYSR